MKSAIVLSALAVASMGAAAQGSKWGLVAAVGWADGGEEIYSGEIVEINNPSKVIPFTIKAASGMQLRVGPEYRFSDTLSVQATIGRSVSDPMGINGSLTFTTTPVEIVANFKPLPTVMVGLGIRKTYADMKGTGVAASYPFLGSFDGAGGGVFELKYLFPIPGRSSSSSSALGLHARFVSEKLRFQQYELNGNHYELGLTVHY